MVAREETSWTLSHKDDSILRGDIRWGCICITGYAWSLSGSITFAGTNPPAKLSEKEGTYVERLTTTP